MFQLKNLTSNVRNLKLFKSFEFSQMSRNSILRNQGRKATISRVKLLPRRELCIQFFITPQVEIRLEMPRVLKGKNHFKRIKINITSITRHDTFEVDCSLL